MTTPTYDTDFSTPGLGGRAALRAEDEKTLDVGKPLLAEEISDLGQSIGECHREPSGTTAAAPAEVSL